MDWTTFTGSVLTFLVGIGGLYATLRSGRTTERKELKAEWTDELSRLRTALKDRDAMVEQLLDQITELHEKLLSKEREIHEKELDLVAMRAEVERLRAELRARREES